MICKPVGYFEFQEQKLKIENFTIICSNVVHYIPCQGGLTTTKQIFKSCAQGETNKNTKYALKRRSMKTPETILRNDNEGDHNICEEYNDRKK